MKDFLMNVALLIGRVSLGSYFAIAGYNKLAGPGTSGFVEQALQRAPGFDSAFNRTYLSSLPTAELVIGSMLVLGIFPRVATLLMVPMLMSFLIAVRDPIHIHGIVGERGAPFDKNFLLLPFALILAVSGGGKIALGPALMGLIRRKKDPAASLAKSAAISR
jgi:uncharacterized membrane protein YphA (DoxX/SURF4 family)